MMASKFQMKEKVLEMLEAIPTDKVFSATFEKSNGEIRRMVCRRGVKKHLKGGESTIREHEDLVSVFDTEASEYRCFDVKRVIHIKGMGKELGKCPDGAVNARGERVKGTGK